MTERTISGLSRRRYLEAVGAAGVVGLAGCSGDGGGGAGGGSGNGNGLTLAQVKGPVEFDPIVLNDVPSDQITNQVVEGLYTYNEEGTDIKPELAAGDPEQNEDGTRWTVEIDENATFQNGDPVTAEDVKYSFEAPVEEETENATELNMIDTVETDGERTVHFNLKYPFGPFKQVLTWYVVPKSVREDDKEGFNQNPVGSGPFEFDDWQEGDFARITRWDDYWGDSQPDLEQVEFVPVEEPTTRVTSITTGENDVIEEIPPKLWDQVEGEDNVSIEEVDAMGYFYLAFNCNEGPTTDPEVREAIDYTFSMDQAVENFVEPTGVRQYSPLPKTVAENWDMPLDEWQNVPNDKDIDEAKSILDGNDNVPDDWTARIIVPPDNKREQLGITVANGIEEAGYSANVQRLDWGAFLDQYVSGDPNDYNMYPLGWSSTIDPDDYLYYFFVEESHGVTDGTYYNGISDQIVEARQTPDREERKRMYEEAITTMLEDRAHLPSYNLKNSFGVREYVNDFRAHPINSFSLVSDWNNVSLDQ
ncbi:ABC transporter substrate-binding protein [Halobacteriales archaeon QS_9_68_17]|nr:MAG: ABC transporter substrate-binding protein [Halobacteriales archaeon QS_9_68_17]